MIKTKKDLKYYLEQDRLNLRRLAKKPAWNDDIWKYEIVLRYHEYYYNKEKKNIFDRLRLRHYTRLHHKLTMKYTTSIPVNVCGPGLSIAHFGCLYINSKAHVGKNLRIQSGVTVGGTAKFPNDLAQIGDNVYIGSGAKVIGPVKIADDVAIGANAVVTKDILEPGTTWAGIPAKKVSDNSSRLFMDERLFPDDPIFRTVDYTYPELDPNRK